MLTPQMHHAILAARYNWKNHLDKLDSREGKNMGHLKTCKCDIWTGISDLVSVDITEKVHLNQIGKQIRGSVKMGLRTGIMKSSGGKGAFVYRLLCDQHKLPISMVGNGDVVIAREYSSETANRITAMHVISGGPKPHSSLGRSLNQSNLTHQQVQDIIAEEYSTFSDEVACALRDIEDNAVLTFNHTITG